MKRWTRFILEVCVTCGVVFGLFWLTDCILLKGRCGAERLIGGIAVGGTIGPVLSLVLIDHLVYRARHWNWRGTLIAVVLGFAGSVASLKLSDMNFSFLLWSFLSLASVTLPPIAGYHFFLRKEPAASCNKMTHALLLAIGFVTVSCRESSSDQQPASVEWWASTNSPAIAYWNGGIMNIEPASVIFAAWPDGVFVRSLNDGWPVQGQLSDYHGERKLRYPDGSVFNPGRATDTKSGGPRLSKAEVLRMAGEAAAKNGYRLADYKAPRAYYEFLDNDGTWTVLYDGEVPRPGNHFRVWMDERTGKTQVMPGE